MTTQLEQYKADLNQVRKELVAIQVFDRTILRASRISERLDYIATLELAISLYEAEDHEEVEALAA